MKRILASIDLLFVSLAAEATFEHQTLISKNSSCQLNAGGLVVDLEKQCFRLVGTSLLSPHLTDMYQQHSLGGI